MSILILNNRLVYVGKVKSLMSELKKLPPHKTVRSLIRENLN
ncbi:MAG: hypothetical protein ACM3UW_08835 [Bacillota bacterium]